jgi:hypothetical protein
MRKRSKRNSLIGETRIELMPDRFFRRDDVSDFGEAIKATAKNAPPVAAASIESYTHETSA